MSEPGSSPARPVWTREVTIRRDELIKDIDLAMKIIGAVYTLYAVWQVAKILNPPLRVKEELVIAAVKRRFGKPPAITLPPLTNADRAALYNDLRG